MWQLLPEWLDMVVRWTHVITGIAWIGSSFYFNWLESKFRPPEIPRDRVEGDGACIAYRAGRGMRRAFVAFIAHDGSLRATSNAPIPVVAYCAA